MTRISLIISLLSLLGLAACTSESPYAPEPEAGEGIALTVSAGDMLPQVVTSRADADPEQKTAAEKQIRTLHIFFFGADGGFLTPTRPEEFAPYMAYDFTDGSQPRVIIPGDTFEGQGAITDATIVAVANIFGSRFRTEWTPEGDITAGAADAQGAVTVNSLADLQQWVYRPKLRTDVSKLPEPGMPMSGLLAGADLTGSDALQLSLRALMARVDVNISLNAAQHSEDGTLPALTVTRFGIMNMPCIVPLFPREGVTEADAEGEIVSEMTTDVASPSTLINGSAPTKFSYYTYENIRRPDDSQFAGYPDGVADTPEARQRWKPRRAHAHASALVMHADYVTRQGLPVKGRFTFYLGANTIDDFEVHRNRVYTNNITVRGLDYVRQTDENVHTFDARVNVTTDSPFYIAMIGERLIDAHWGVLPTDYYFLSAAPEGSEIKVEILEPERHPWIRLEHCDAAGRADADIVPGWGCRPYFTTDLVTATLAANTECTVTSNRSRVYFYIDENASTADRAVSVRFTFTAPGAEPIVNTAEFLQHGLIPFTSGGTTYYMEAYEEYAEHRDPLDPHTTTPWYQPDGLPWAREGSTLNGYEVGYAKYRIWPPGIDWKPFNTTTTGGQQMTNHLLTTIEPVSDLAIYSSKLPSSAIQYAASLNKRNNQGNPASTVWFLPGISELEDLMLATSNTVPLFRQYYYWSASTAKNPNTIASISEERENHWRARATMILADGNCAQSGDKGASSTADSNRNKDLNSEQDYPNGGRTLRTQKLRVRAIRTADGVDAN